MAMHSGQKGVKGPAQKANTRLNAVIKWNFPSVKNKTIPNKNTHNKNREAATKNNIARLCQSFTCCQIHLKKFLIFIKIFFIKFTFNFFIILTQKF